MKKTLILLCLIFTGCTVPKRPSMTTEIDLMKGKPFDDVITAWGYPQAERTIQGRKMVYWENYYGDKLSKDGKSAVSNHCTRILEINEQGKIVGGSWEGQGCGGVAFELCCNRNKTMWCRE